MMSEEQKNAKVKNAKDIFLQKEMSGVQWWSQFRQQVY